MSIIGRTCRTCGKVSEVVGDSFLFPLFNAVDFKSELEVILEEFEIWNLNISENDGLPQQICLICFDSFCQIHNFRILCIETQMNFGEMCTGLDIFIKEGSIDKEDNLSENYDEFESVTVQEYYTFPDDERLKSPISQEPEKEKLSSSFDSDEEPIVKQENGTTETIIPDFKEFRCEYCMEIVSFDDPDQLNEHYNKLHSTNLPYTCPKCEKCFNTKAKRNSHARIHYNKVVNCEKCGQKVRGGKKMMMQHIDYNHVEKDRECPTCGKLFKMSSLKRLNYHLIWHDESKLHKCKFCDKKFIQTTHLLVHERTHTGECPYKCQHCGLAFRNANLLSTHVRVHGNKELPCTECPKIFYHHHALRMHMRVHDPARKKHECKICNITYGGSLNLRLHNYKKHGGPATPAMLNIIRKRETKHPIIKPFKCNECPEAFVLHTQLIKHIKIHSEDRPFSCSVCFKAFKRHAHMKYHMDTQHLKKKPFKCTLCKWAFPQKNNLTEHFAAKHGTKKEFKCQVCGKEFATIKSLKTHKITHSDKKPFVCTVCNRAFKKLFALRNHMNTHLRNNEADLEGGDITDIVVEEELLEQLST